MKFEEAGRRLIKEGKVAALIVAGGQATRLKAKGSKGLYPVSITGKTLFQIFAEKTKACSTWAGRDLPLCIMTSPLNDTEIKTYFQQNGNFGLKNLHFFTQGMLPLRDLNGKELPQQGPDGNGSALEKLKTSGLLDKLGVEVVTFSLIDNPLIDPFDARLIGYLKLEKLDAALVAIPRIPGEKTGVIVEAENGVRVVEYTELKGDEPQGLANISAFAFSTDFIERVAKVELPLHEQKKDQVLKYEKFIFDVLPYAKKCGALLYPREEVFAPLKTLECLEKVKQALVQRDRQVYEKVTGKKAPEKEFELDFSFYYPTEELLKREKR